MSRFNFEKLKERAKDLFKVEVDSSRSIQDEVKVYNERFPNYLMPIHKMLKDIEDAGKGGGGQVGEFGEMTGDSNEEKVWSFWLSKGLGKHAVAGIMGNIYHESGFDPTTIQGNGAGPAQGLFQWEHKGPNNGKRWQAMVDYTVKNGGTEEDAWELLPQNEYAYWELSSGDHDWSWKRVNNYPNVNHDISGSSAEAIKKFGAIEDTDQTTHIFERVFFRSASTDSSHHQAKTITRRQEKAKEYYEQFKDWDPSTASAGTFVEPYKGVSYTVTSDFGGRADPFSGAWTGHSGIDLSTGTNTPLYSVAAGSVVHVSSDNGTGWGNHVVINHGNVGGKNVFSLYAHMNTMSSLSVGESVSTSTRVGFEGTTGQSTGIHLHLEIREGTSGQSWGQTTRVDPRNYITFKG